MPDLPTTEPKRIKLPTLSFLHQEIVERMQHYIELYPDRIHILREFVANERDSLPDGSYDDSMPLKRRYNYMEEDYKREVLSGVVLLPVENYNERYCVTILVRGSMDMKVYFGKLADARDFRNKIFTYIFGHE